MLRDEIAYEIYKQGRATKATMSFDEFVASDCCYADTPTWRDAADAILALPEFIEATEKAKRYDELFREYWIKDKWDTPEEMVKEWKEKSEALDILEYGYPQEVQKALEKVRGK